MPVLHLPAATLTTWSFWPANCCWFYSIAFLFLVFFFFSFFRSLVFVSWSAEIHTRQFNCCNFLSWKLVVCTSISSMLSMGLRMRKNYLIFLSVWESRHILCCRHMHTAAIEILALILVMSVGKHF